MADQLEHNLPVFTVSEISIAVKRAIEDRFPLVRIRGEISGLSRPASGHVYFKLKDDDAVIEAVSWRGSVAKLGIKPEDGMDIIATGRITTYASGGVSKYQIIVESMELAGEGALLKLLEDRRKKLAAEGLFDEDRKQDIPFLPDVIGVVTSPTGAVIRDILHRISDRFPRRVILWPVAVQGEKAADEIIAAIKGFNGLGPKSKVPRPDVLIVGRGGGSLEDMMAFNEESVVRAVAASAIPVISAVGHETDTTLTDYAADLRAPTPTAAAEHAVPVRLELMEGVAAFARRLDRAAVRLLDGHEKDLKGLARGLPNLRRLTDEAIQRLDDWSGRLGRSLLVGFDRRQSRLAEARSRLRTPVQQIKAAELRLEGGTRALGRVMRTLMGSRTRALAHVGALLQSYSYERVLERGFALVTDGGGVRIDRASQTRPGMALDIRFFDDTVRARTEGAAPAKTKPKKPDPDDGQGSLL